MQISFHACRVVWLATELYHDGVLLSGQTLMWWLICFALLRIAQKRECRRVCVCVRGWVYVWWLIGQCVSLCGAKLIDETRKWSKSSLCNYWAEAKISWRDEAKSRLPLQWIYLYVCECVCIMHICADCTFACVELTRSTRRRSQSSVERTGTAVSRELPRASPSPTASLTPGASFPSIFHFLLHAVARQSHKDKCNWKM